MGIHQRQLDRVVSCLGDLPALPSIVAEVLNITENPSVAMSEIGECVQRDPVLTAKILKVSNSPYYGMKQYVGTLKLALVVLGVREVRNIVLGVCVFEHLRDERVEAMLMHGFWEHSTRVAALSKQLGGTLGLGLKSEDFVAGLLHDVGKIVLLRQVGEDYVKILKASGGGSAPLCESEMKRLGFDHAEAAAALAACWNLPRTLADALWCHHVHDSRSLADAKDPRLAAVVRIANRAAHEDFLDDGAVPGPSCMDEEAWSFLVPYGAPASRKGRHAMLAGFVAGFDPNAAPVI